MSADNAEVLQGRLGWESGDISEAKPGELQPHPKNTEIYGDTDDIGDLDETFKESIAEKGVLEPLVITNGKEIISGHRRWLAAKDAGLNSVPVRYSEFDNDLAEREALIEFNRQREKTAGQIVNEFEEMKEIEVEKGNQVSKSNLKQGCQSPDVENFQNRDEFDKPAHERAAEKIGADVSGRTLEKGKTVKEKAESDDEPEEVQEAAQEAWDGLQSGDESFSSAYQTVKDAENDAGESDDEHTVVDAATKQETDEWSSPRELVEPLENALGGFDLDPCSGAETSPFAANTYTEDDDGLAQDWFGAVWVNPPYSQMDEWTEKAAAEVARGNADTVLYLCKGDSSTAWWQAGAEQASAICAIDHRLSFGDGGNSAPFASHIFVFGECPDAVVDELADHGLILRPEVSVDD